MKKCPLSLKRAGSLVISWLGKLVEDCSKKCTIFVAVQAHGKYFRDRTYPLGLSKTRSKNAPEKDQDEKNGQNSWGKLYENKICRLGVK